MTPGEYFARFADENEVHWTAAVGSTVEHSEYGTGAIVSIRPRDKNGPLVYVQFIDETNPRTFNSQSFRSGKVTQIQISSFSRSSFEKWKENFDEAQRRENEEKAALEHGREALREIANVYGLELRKLINSDGPTILAPILLRVDNRELLADAEVKALESERLHKMVATYFYRRFNASRDTWDLYRRFNASRDTWDLAKACSALRRAGQANRALDVSAQIETQAPSDARAASALWTTRGGAFRDIRQLNDARRCALRAAELAPNSYQPHNLLGALYYEEGSLEKGQSHFDHATELGSSPRFQEAEIRSVLGRVPIQRKRDIAQYLLVKNPSLFAWAQAFL